MKSKQKEVMKILRKIDYNKIHYLKANSKEEFIKDTYNLKDEWFLVISKNQFYWLRCDAEYIEPNRLVAFGFSKKADEMGLYFVGKLRNVNLWLEK